MLGSAFFIVSRHLDLSQDSHSLMSMSMPMSGWFGAKSSKFGDSYHGGLLLPRDHPKPDRMVATMRSREPERTHPPRPHTRRQLDHHYSLTGQNHPTARSRATSERAGLPSAAIHRSATAFHRRAAHDQPDQPHRPNQPSAPHSRGQRRLLSNLLVSCKVVPLTIC